MNALALVALGGGLGAAARYAGVLAMAAGKWSPIATLPINIAGCFAAGLIAALLRGDAHSGWRLLIGTGFLGGFTTFSAFSLETAALIADARAVGIAYALLTSVFCVAAAFIGLWCGRFFAP